MALAKDLDIGNGYSAAYHRVGHYAVDHVTQKTTARIDSYKDADTRKANEGAVAASRSFELDGMPTGDAFAWIYDAVKAIPGGDFADAADS
jgi:hypothetical protein